mmetsp:Transcript_33594/g.41287  ORF Transcript_33594/g.41287 Transcript_33594/m.41287 type:complete len:103 (-) Transcript_33594:1429-1737(-)
MTLWPQLPNPGRIRGRLLGRSGFIKSKKMRAIESSREKNTLDKDELEEIEELERKIKEREEWENTEKAKLEYEKGLKKRQKGKLLGKAKPAHNADVKWEMHM